MSFRNAPLAVTHSCDKSAIFTSEIRAAIDALIAKYPTDWKQSAVMPTLTLVQDANDGWLTTELMNAVAAYLDMPEVSVYEVATFYGMYDLEPQGKHKVCICNSVSCLLRGSDTLLHHVESKYNVHPNEITADGRFTLKEVECLGACCGAPAVMIDKQYYENLSPGSLDKLIDGLE
ncbi:NAD(P)H-dependent oxidoreductase subunit E [Chromatium okenii]|uniref:NADH-quinone oxidoreductase subunit NuoE family protein n=1 Tax=Chromatium okenii TaxID=61644 RepID=UPI00190520A1|nr:NAD(P)H-dependent oxidoreductase subunit E [Chromatium okenii]MBK1641706.1 NAD(P)H-dependent oxidoreductase subunit E [Chromatium okenii]